MLRFSGCDDNFDTMEGMHWVELTASNAISIHKAVVAALAQFCTPRIGAPFARRGHQLGTDGDLLMTIMDHTEITSSNKASVEMRVNRMLRGRTHAIEVTTAVFNNVRCHIPDVTHASVRLIKKPWRADNYLAKILELMI